MANPTTVSANGADRRLLLVDFDWQDADLMPELLQHPGVSVRLVAGAQYDDAGIRLAELCGLPRTVDLADLTREIFDLALVSERSPRRTQIEGLLLALGTPSITPQAFLSGEQQVAGEPSVEAPLALQTPTLETTVGVGDLETFMEQALPDVSGETPSGPGPVAEPVAPRPHVASLPQFPSPEDRQALEATLRNVMEATGARRAELHLVGPDQSETAIELGAPDALLGSLVTLARQLGGPQVVGGLTGQQEGKAWGAWPFRTVHRQGVIAAGGIDPVTGWTAWERTATALRDAWDTRERELAGPAFPFLPERYPRWLDAEDFSTRLELAVERNRRDGLRFHVHRFVFPGPAPVVATLCERLPARLRDMDCLARPTPQTVVLLTAGSEEAFAHVRRRLASLWEDVWMEAGEPKPAPDVTDEATRLATPADEAGFLATARAWSARPS